MKFNGERSIIAIMMLIFILFISISMVSASQDISIGDDSLSDDAVIGESSSIKIDENYVDTNANTKAADNNDVSDGLDDGLKSDSVNDKKLSDERNGSIMVEPKYSYDGVSPNLTVQFKVWDTWDNNITGNGTVTHNGKVIFNGTYIRNANFSNDVYNITLDPGPNDIRFHYDYHGKYNLDTGIYVLKFNDTAHFNFNPGLQHFAQYNSYEDSDFDFYVNVTDSDGNILNNGFTIRVEDRYDMHKVVYETQNVSEANITIPKSVLLNGRSYDVICSLIHNDYDYYAREFTFFITRFAKETPQFILNYDSQVTDDATNVTVRLINGNRFSVHGDINVTLNGEYLYTIKSPENQTILIENLKPGMNDIRFIYGGSEEYKPVSTVIGIDKFLSATNITIVPSVDYIAPGSEYFFDVAIRDGNGTVIPKKVNVKVTGSFSVLLIKDINGSDRLVLPTDALYPRDTVKINVSFAGDEEYLPSSAVLEIPIGEKYPSQIEVIYSPSVSESNPVVYYKLTGPLGNFEDDISLYVNGDLISKIRSQDDWADVRIPLKQGVNEVKFVYNGSKAYNSTEYVVNMTSYPYESNINIDISKYPIIGQDYTFDVNLTDGNGNLIDRTFYVRVANVNGSSDDTFTVNNGSGNITIAGVAIIEGAEFSIQASFRGDGQYPSASASDILTVPGKLPTYIPLNYDDVTSNGTATITFALECGSDKISDVIKFYLNGQLAATATSVEGDYSDVAISNLKLGANEIKVEYEGSDRYEPYSTSFNLSYKKNTKFTYDIPQVAFLAQNFTFKANLTDIDGNVLGDGFTVNVNDRNLFNVSFDTVSDRKVVIEGIKKGYYEVIFNFTGSDNYNPSHEFAYFTLYSNDTVIELSYDGPVEGDTATVNVILKNPDAALILNGLVDIYFDDDYVTTVTTSSLSKVTINGLKNGYNKVDAVYRGNETFAPSNATIFVKSNIPTTVVAESKFTLDIDGDKAIAVLSDLNDVPIANASVKAIVNGQEQNLTTDASGSVSVDIKDNDTVKFIYTDEDNVTISAVARYIKETKVIPDPVVPSSEFALEMGESEIKVILTKEGEAVSGAVVTVDVDGALSNKTTDANGSFIVPIEENSTVKLTYVEDNGAILESSAQVFDKAVIPVLPNGSFDIVANETEVKAILLDKDGKAISGATVSVEYDGNVSDMTTDADGSIVIPIVANATLKLTYLEDDGAKLIYVTQVIYNNATVEVPVVVERQSTNIICKNMTTKAVAVPDGRVGEWFTFTLVDGNGNPLAGKAIAIGFNGKVYNKTTNATGEARLQINLAKVGKYTFVVAFLGDDEYNGTMAAAFVNVTQHVPKLTASAKSFKASAKTKTISATFKTANGNAISGKKISFTVNGKTYTAKTNSKGVASVKIALTKKGTYTAAAKFAGDNTYKATSTKFKVTIK